MARIRSIHPGLVADEAFMSMSMPAKAAWMLLWMECDDQGVFEWKPITLKARMFPADTIDMTAILTQWLLLKVIVRFEVDGKFYGAVRNFQRYQRPKSPKKFYPLPDHIAAFASGSSRGSSVTDGLMSFTRDATAAERQARKRAKNRQAAADSHGSDVTDGEIGHDTGVTHSNIVTDQPSQFPGNGELSRPMEMEDVGSKSNNPPNPPSGGWPPTEKSGSKKSTKLTRVPTGLRLQGLRDYFLERAEHAGIPNSEREFDQFIDYHLQRNSAFADWNAAVRTWLRNAMKFAEEARDRSRYRGGAGPPTLLQRSTNGFTTILNEFDREDREHASSTVIDVTPNQSGGPGGTDGR